MAFTAVVTAQSYHSVPLSVARHASASGWAGGEPRGAGSRVRDQSDTAQRCGAIRAQRLIRQHRPHREGLRVSASELLAE